jgi:hypothetical protein
MKPITIFEAPDGSRFNSAQDCLSYESMLCVLQAVTLLLGEAVPDSNGKNFIQHTKEKVERFDATFERVIRTYFGNECGDLYQQHPTGFVWRLLSDRQHPMNDAVCRAGYRRQCIDGQFREWGQPYFALNPDPEAKAL